MPGPSIPHPPPGTATAVTTELQVGGMNCANCARHVLEALQGVAGVASAAVQLESGQATVRWAPDAVASVPRIVEAVSRAGYTARIAAPAEGGGSASTVSPLAVWRFNIICGAVLTLPLLVGEWGFGLGNHPGFRWLGFACAAPVVLVCGRRFFIGAWQQLRRGRSNMDTLVALGSATAFGFSAWGLFSGWPGHLYFMEAAAIVTLISLGHWLEALAGERAAGSLRTLMDLTPPRARRLDASGQAREVPVAELRVEDRVALRPGDRVPTDGEVMEGRSAVDESMLTGESMPVEKGQGMRLYAGTVNQDGGLVMRVTATGEATALARIVEVVQRAQTSRASIQRLADRVSSVFVPIVVLVAVGTALAWGFAFEPTLGFARGLAAALWHVNFPESALAAAFIHAAAVLIVACPCAMGLATPAAIMAGTHTAARRGILIRDGLALEKSGRLTTLVFDKTGTLTSGRLTVAAFQEFAGAQVSAPGPKEVAVRLARPSNHPISRALVAALPLSGPDSIEDWREVRGCGVQGRISGGQGGEFRLGSMTWLSEQGVDPTPAAAFVESWTFQGATVLGIAGDGRLIGAVALQDQLKPHAADVVRRLAERGYSVCLVTGDHPRTARAVAESVGIPGSAVFAGIRPGGKAELIQQLQRRGERVAFVGDGINDAPALSQADLGIAVSQASDVAKEAADVILLRSDVQGIPEALDLAQATLRTIHQNLFWAFFYNAAAVPLAALGLLSPILCALAMGVSDLVVIGNALRLQRWRRSTRA